MKKDHQKIGATLEARLTADRPSREVYLTADLPSWLRAEIAVSRAPEWCTSFNHELSTSDQPCVSPYRGAKL